MPEPSHLKRNDIDFGYIKMELPRYVWIDGKWQNYLNPYLNYSTYRQIMKHLDEGSVSYRCISEWLKNKRSWESLLNHFKDILNESTNIKGRNIEIE